MLPWWVKVMLMSESESEADGGVAVVWGSSSAIFLM